MHASRINGNARGYGSRLSLRSAGMTAEWWRACCADLGGASAASQIPDVAALIRATGYGLLIWGPWRLFAGACRFVNCFCQPLGLAILFDDEMIGTTPALFVDSWYAFHQPQVDQFFHMFCDVAVRLAAHLGESRGRHWPFEGLQQVDQRE